MYAIRKKRGGKWICDSNRCGLDSRKKVSNTHALLFETYSDAKWEFAIRKLTEQYEIVEVRLEVVE